LTPSSASLPIKAPLISVLSNAYSINLVMKGQKPKAASWRAFAQGKQIGSGYASKTEALEAAQEFFDKEDDGSTTPNLIARPSSLPIKKHGEYVF
jgi:hypothetical protein